jgi:hypothetical protein
VVDEITITGDLIDPDIQKVEQNLARELGEFLSQEKEVFLLSCFRLKMQLALY